MTVYCFSATGRTLTVARQAAALLGVPVRELSEPEAEKDTAVVVFPVYGQTLPTPVRTVLRRLTAAHVALIAVYGGFHHGNALQEAERLISGTVIGGAYVPTAHTYLREHRDFDPAPLLPLIDRIQHPRAAVMPRFRRQLWAIPFAGARARLAVRLRKTDACTGCGLCSQRCPMAGKACIRCLRCAEECPNQALQVILNPFLRRYLRGMRQTQTEVFI